MIFTFARRNQRVHRILFSVVVLRYVYHRFNRISSHCIGARRGIFIPRQGHFLASGVARPRNGLESEYTECRGMLHPHCHRVILFRASSYYCSECDQCGCVYPNHAYWRWNEDRVLPWYSCVRCL